MAVIKLESKWFIKATGKQIGRPVIIAPADGKPQLFPTLNIRSHWAIENKLHWILGVVFKDDLAGSLRGTLLENFSMVRKSRSKCLNVYLT